MWAKTYANETVMSSAKFIEPMTVSVAYVLADVCVCACVCELAVRVRPKTYANETVMSSTKFIEPMTVSFAYVG